MTDNAPRSWRSILFRAGRPPLRRRTAILLCLGFLAATLVLDVLLLTNARVLGRIAEVQIRARAGDLLAFESLTLTIGGQLRMERAELRFPDPARPLLTARRIRVSIGHRDGGIVAESVTLEEPRIRFSDAIATEIEGPGGAPRRPLRDLVPARHLPRLLCRGGTLELAHSEVLADGASQVFDILDLAMVPTTGYRYFVRGRLRNAVVGEWTVQGEIDLDSGDHRVHLANDRLVLGPAIREALKPSIHDAWDKYRPAGPAGADVYLACDRENPAGDVAFRLTLKPRGMSLLYRHFPYPCEQVRGEIEFRADGFTIKGIEARSGASTKIRFDGVADGYEADAGYHFRVEMDDVAMDDTLRNALKKEAQDVWARFKPSGRLDARAVIRRERGGPEVKESIPVDLRFKDASLVFSGFPYPIERVTGEVRVDGDDVVIQRLQGVRGRGEFRIAGRIDSIGSDAEIDLDVRVVSLELDGRLRDALAPEPRQVFDRVGPSGEVDLDVRILRSRGGDPRIRATARARGNRILLKDAPLPVLIREGTVEYHEGRVRLHHLKGMVDPAGEIEVSGEISTGPAGTTTRLLIDGSGIPIDDRFRDRMPKTISEVLKTVGVSGIADFKFTLEEFPERDRTGMRVALYLDLRKGAIAAAVPVADIDGTVVLVGPIRDGRPTLSGRIDVRSARILMKQVRNLTTNLTIQGSRLDFRDIAGDAYGGKLSGWFSLDTATSDLEGDFAVSRLDLREFVSDTAKWSGKAIGGKVDIRIPGLTGKANDVASLRSGAGGCSLVITEGLLLDVPGIVNFLDPFADGRFTAMKAFFDIRDGKFKIKEFAFLGREGGGSVIGQGDFFFNGRFKLKVRTETASLFGLDFFFTNLPGMLFDLFKKPFKKVVEGTLEDSKFFEE